MGRVIRDTETLKDLAAYEIISEEALPDISGFGIVLRHKKSGARVVLVSNDDNNKVFCIGFRTPPEDSTGVAHILEHSVLCGSERFPSKDPFAELAKGSLNTFLNAMTYPDKTIYPVASCNEKDLANLMEVYMDAVLFPNIYHRKEIFLQEGWHYELEDVASPLSYNGVVYSEMKGAFSNPEQLLYSEMEQALFPDTAYGTESGGDPDVIPQLTYEQFLEFHRRYYHPVNSYIYLYGNMDMRERLEWLDRAYLSRFDRIELDSSLKEQAPFCKRKEIEKHYSVNTPEEAKDAAHFSYSAVLEAGCGVEKETAFSVLCNALFNTEGAPVKEALIKAGIGQDSYAMFNDAMLQPLFSLVVKNAPAEKAEEFKTLVLQTLAACVKKGIDKKSLYAALNQIEFTCREADTGRYPKGLVYGQMILAKWLYDENRLFDNIKWSPVFEKLRGLIATDYFEQLVQKYLIDNTHTAFLTLLPEAGLLARKETALKEKLSAYRDSLPEKELSELAAQTKALKKYQEEPSTPEELAAIPRLTREDIKREADPFINEVKKMGDITALHQELFTNGIAYVKLLFDMKNVPAELLPYSAMLARIFGSMDTKQHGYFDLNNELSIHTGGIFSSILVSADYDDIHQYRVHFLTEGKALYGKLPELFSCFRELLTETVFDNPARIREILRMQKSGFESDFIDMAQGAALRRATSYFAEVGVAWEQTAGISYYEFISELLEHFDERKEGLVAKLRETYECIFAKDVLTLSVTADAEGYRLAEEQSGSLFEAFAEHAKGSGLVLAPEKKNEGFITPGQVQYVCCAGDYRAAGLSYTGAYDVLRTAMNYGYLWNNVRVLGGAYGAALLAVENGRIAFYSWRDPHLDRTMKVYEDAVDYIEHFDADEAEVTKYVIGTMSAVDMPRSPRMEGERGVTAWLTGNTSASVQKHREEILDVTVEDIRALAAGVRAMLSQNCCCTIGSEAKVREDAARFLTVKELLR